MTATSTSAAGPARTLTRRTLFQGSAFGLGAVALGGLGFAGAAQIDTTPLEVSDTTTTAIEGETVASVAAQLNYDAGAIFAFVRDEIRYETYAGILRGATGTLWARAGNSADQAVLLGALLAASQIPHRFAIGPLATEAETSLIELLTPSTDDAILAYQRTTAAAHLAVRSLDEVPPTALSADDQALVETAVTRANAAIDSAIGSSERVNTIIADALETSGIGLPPLPGATLVERERHSHSWVQVSDGPDWLDLDPTLGNSSPPTTPTAIFKDFPGDWEHGVRVSVGADDLRAGSLSRREVVAYTTTSQRAFETPIAVQLAPAEGIAGLGNTLTRAVAGQVTVLPSIFADGDAVGGTQPLYFSSATGAVDDVLAPGTPAAGAPDGETVAAWLVVEITSPDSAPVTIERAILDRVPPLDRESGTINPATIAPIRLSSSTIDEVVVENVVEFDRFLVLYVDVARIPDAYALARATTDQLLGTIHTFGPGLASIRDGLGVQLEGGSGIWSYPSAPNITTFTFGAGQDGDSETEAMTIDILHRQRTSHLLRDVDIPNAFHPLVLSGVLDAIAEHMFLLPDMRGDSAATAPDPASIVSIFASAHAAGSPIRVIAAPQDLAGVDLGEAARIRIERALAEGYIVIMPAQPVDLDGFALAGWWVVDPATGRTTDQLQDGTGGASAAIGLAIVARQETPWYATWIAWFRAHRAGFSCLGNVMAWMSAIATGILSLTVAEREGLLTQTETQAGLGIALFGGFGTLARLAAACV